MTITEPDERWAEYGRQACRALAPYFAAVEHVGSTAVPGLAAQPEIDLLAAAEDLDDVQDERLDHFGYKLQPSPVPDQLYYRRENWDSTFFNLYVVPLRDWETHDARVVRDYLRMRTDARDDYAASKKQLMDRHGPGAEYEAGKTALIRELAKTARGGR